MSETNGRDQACSAEPITDATIDSRASKPCFDRDGFPVSRYDGWPLPFKGTHAPDDGFDYTQDSGIRVSGGVGPDGQRILLRSWSVK
jgi:hypothetical protein